MIFLILTLIFMGALISTYWLDSRPSNQYKDYDDAKIGWTVATVVMGLVFTISIIIGYVSQVDNYENLKMLTEQSIIFKDREDSLIALNNAMDKKYIAREDSTLKINGKSNNTIIALPTKYADIALQITKNLTDTKDKLYQIKIDQTVVEKNIRTNRRNICYISWFLPTK